jgi:glutaredoxin-related protein
MDSLSELAVKYGCSRFEWMTDDTNLRAQAFYRDLGAPLDESKLFYRVGLPAGEETSG